MSEEPWLGGPVAGIIAELQPVAHELIFMKSELDRILDGVSDDVVWKTPAGAASIGYHIRHCSGSTLRMLTYARGQSLSNQQFAEFEAESVPDPSLGAAQLMHIAQSAIDQAMEFIKHVRPEQLDEERLVGRKKLTTNLRGLMHEIAMHTARHVGQIATTVQVLRDG